MEYFCKIQGKHSGPFDVQELNDMLSSGVINSKTKIFNSAVKNWVPISTVEGIDSTLASKPAGGSGNIAGLAIVVVLILACAAGAGFYFMKGKSKSPADSLKAASKDYLGATAVVMAVGDNSRTPIATAFAVSPSLFATNAHVVEAVQKYTKLGRSCFVVTHTGKETYKVTNSIMHPKYTKEVHSELNAAGKRPTVWGYDVGILEVEGNHKLRFKLADEETYKALASGTPIAFLGFPMEGLASGNIAIESPLATMQTGVVTSVSDFWLADSGVDKNLLIRHNLPAAGGASGSPIFDENGNVVSVLNGGNVSFQIDAQTNQVRRNASAALVNFAMRVDMLIELLDQAYPNWRK